jgi:hypothetical protein
MPISILLIAATHAHTIIIFIKQLREPTCGTRSARGVRGARGAPLPLRCHRQNQIELTHNAVKYAERR